MCTEILIFNWTKWIGWLGPMKESIKWNTMHFHIKYSIFVSQCLTEFSAEKKNGCIAWNNIPKTRNICIAEQIWQHRCMVGNVFFPFSCVRFVFRLFSADILSFSHTIPHPNGKTFMGKYAFRFCYGMCYGSNY